MTLPDLALGIANIYFGLAFLTILLFIFAIALGFNPRGIQRVWQRWQDRRLIAKLEKLEAALIRTAEAVERDDEDDAGAYGLFYDAAAIRRVIEILHQRK